MMMAGCLISSTSVPSNSNGVLNGTKKHNNVYTGKGVHNGIISVNSSLGSSSPASFQRNDLIMCPSSITQTTESASPSSQLSTIRTVRLRRDGNTPFGFSIRGGWEHGTGIFVSEVHSGSEACKEGLLTGDQILRVNGVCIERAIHDEVITLIKSTNKITLKVKTVGMIPIKNTPNESLSWKIIEIKCPLHSPASTASNASSSSHSEGSTIGDIEHVEAKVFINLSDGEGLGCSVVKGPAGFPGIFVQAVKPHGIAQSSGLEPGDQIIQMNSFSFIESNTEFNDAIEKIKSCRQMTLTVRKKVGLHLFHLNKQQKVKAIVHENPETCTTNLEVVHQNHHIKLCSKQSGSSTSTSISTDSDNQLSSHDQRFCFNDPSEHDFSMSEIESNENDHVVEISPSPEKIYEQVKKQEERLAEEKKKLEHEQKKLKEELQRLEDQRKQLEHLKSQDEVKSISSSSTSSIGSGFGPGIPIPPSPISLKSSISSSSGSQLGFLDEIKKLAEKRNGEDGLLTATLNKTRQLKKQDEEVAKNKVNLGNDVNKKRHEMLMEEFKKAHSRMFGTTNDVGHELMNKIPLRSTKSASCVPETVTTTPNGDKITILNTCLSKKQPAPPVPLKKSGGPIVTISTYESTNQPKNRFIVNNSNNKSVITVGNGLMSNENNKENSNRIEHETQQHKPIQIKINLKLPTNDK